MTTRKDVEEALVALDNLIIPDGEHVYDNCDALLYHHSDIIKQALQEKLNRFDTIGTVEYVQEQE